MREVFNKILERCEENAFEVHTREYGNVDVVGIDAINDVIEQVADEYKGGWIPCSERLPEIRQDCLVTVRYTGFMGMYGFWVKTGHMEAENDWWGDCAGGEVIAWQPLPEPYQEIKKSNESDALRKEDADQ